MLPPDTWFLGTGVADETDMDDDLEEFVTEFYASDEIDLDYEFDAARFYDFTRSETDSEDREAERWFESAGNYPPSRKHFLRTLCIFFC